MKQFNSLKKVAKIDFNVTAGKDIPALSLPVTIAAEGHQGNTVTIKMERNDFEALAGSDYVGDFFQGAVSKLRENYIGTPLRDRVFYGGRPFSYRVDVSGSIYNYRQYTSSFFDEFNRVFKTNAVILNKTKFIMPNTNIHDIDKVQVRRIVGLFNELPYPVMCYGAFKYSDIVKKNSNPDDDYGEALKNMGFVKPRSKALGIATFNKLKAALNDLGRHEKNLVARIPT